MSEFELSMKYHERIEEGADEVVDPGIDWLVEWEKAQGWIGVMEG